MPKDEVTEKEVQATRKRVDNLNQKIVDAKAELMASEASRNNTVRKAQLEQSEQSLEKELAFLRDQIKTSKTLPADEVPEPPEVSQPSADVK